MRRAAALVIFRVWEALIYLLALYWGARAAVDAPLAWGAAELGLVLATAALWSWLLQSLGLYASRRFASRLEEAGIVVAATTGTAGALAVVGALTRLPFASADFVVPFWIGLTAATVLGRMATRAVLGVLRRRGRNLRFVVVVGAGERGTKLARRIVAEPGLGYRLRGVVDDDADMLSTLSADFERLGDVEALGRLLAREPIDEVLITLPLRSGYDQTVAALRQCERFGVPARVFADFFESETLKTRVERIGSSFSLKVYNGPTPGMATGLKRAFDVVAALGGLVVLAPLLALIAVAIKLDSPDGPIFFAQRRVGFNKRRFRLYKFRTMVPDADALMPQLEHLNEASGPHFKIRHDPRVTRLGRVLRRYSLDELPQLLNVLLGDMSMVGPRPLPVRDVERFEHDWHVRRFSVRPGLTCSWVLSGRSELAFDAWVELDLDYIDNWSLKKDFSIFFRTIPALLTRAGAY
jgi:exopolysaccharide biosynthesis polyprenyl glycosylphosphotransferase